MSLSDGSLQIRARVRTLSAALTLFLIFGSGLFSPGFSALDLASRFAAQGEYLGSNEAGDSLGVQVIALGSDQFKANVLMGGLPGQGWNGGVPIACAGTWQDSVLQFQHPSGWNFGLDLRAYLVRGEDGGGRQVELGKAFRQSPTLGEAAPQDAKILFDTLSLQAWQYASLDETGFLIPGSTSPLGGAVSVEKFSDFRLHLEFQIPFLPDATGQSRGNSGVYLQNRYEIQILDSFGIFPADSLEASRQCGAVWEQSPPRIPMTYPPGAWQTYDIDFTAARFENDGKTLQSRARVTLIHNGIPVQSDWVFPDRTVQGDLESPEPGPLRLQWHGEKVLYRNIWIQEKPASVIFPRNRARIYRPLHPETKPFFLDLLGRKKDWRLDSPHLYAIPFRLQYPQ